jgi:hypothetical protein
MAKLRKVNGMLADKNLTEKIDRAKYTSKKANWAHWYDEYPVPEKMIEFLKLLKQQMPRTNIYPSNLLRTDLEYHEDDVRGVAYIVDEFSILMDGSPFDLGRVGFKDYSANGGNNSYGIYSRKISNPKFAEHRDQHNMVMSSDVRKAVKNASKYIVPYTNIELAKAYYSDIQNSVVDVHNKAQGKMHQLSRDISNDRNSILAEVLHLKKMGVSFKTEVFKRVAEVIEEFMSEAMAEQKRKVQCVFVRFRKIGDDTYADIQEADDVRNNSVRLMASSPSATYAMSELPEDIVGSISVLNILNDGQYVAKVGMKIDDFTFWIERN